MARPNKQGLEYYPNDVDIHDDDKIALISSKFGAIGEAVIWRLFCKIYKNGYYYEWGEDECMLFCRWSGGIFNTEQVDKIVSECISRDIFDSGIFNRFGILTSRGIQKRFIKATNERKEVEIKEDLWLIDIPNSARFNVIPPINGVIPPINQEKQPIKTQSKVKESKVKESKEIYSDFSFVDDAFKNTFLSWLEYKKNRKEPYKTQQTLEACYRKLIRLSRGDPDVASQIIDESLANNWSGFFELKTNTYNGQGITKKSQRDNESEERKATIAREGADAVAELRSRSS
jgi:hypothetical protein